MTFEATRPLFDPAHKVRSPVPYRQAHHIPLLRRIACPVLSLHPQWPPFSPEDVALLEGEIRDLRVSVIPDTSHMMLLEESAEIAARILAFWQVLPGIISTLTPLPDPQSP
jgi:pimeloyl-ACP methyl ester carboxylesterase